jgi:hypothetical protein
MSTTKTRNDATPKNDATNNATNDATPKTFSVAQLTRDLGKNPKMVRARLRRVYDHKNDVMLNDDASLSFIRERRCKRAKHVWVYFIDALDAMREFIKRDDDA